MRLKGKVALITGAAMGIEGERMGIGGATARMFAREGAKVVLCDVNEELGERTASQLRGEGHEAVFVRLDVTVEPEWIEAVQTAISSFGRLDVLVNAAGTVGPRGVEDTLEEEWDAQMAVHAKGPFLGTKHVIPEMRRAGGGSIINISSINGLTGSPSAAYGAGKGASRIFSKAAAIQYAGDKIRVNSMHPGFVLTPLSRSRVGAPGGYTEEELAVQRVETTPMGREAVADEIAYGILYLASDESSFVTGSELVIDGGFNAQ